MGDVIMVGPLSSQSRDKAAETLLSSSTCTRRPLDVTLGGPLSSQSHDATETLLSSSTCTQWPLEDYVSELQDSIALRYALAAPCCVEETPGQSSSPRGELDVEQDDADGDDFSFGHVDELSAEIENYYERCRSLLLLLASGNAHFTDMIQHKIDQAKEEGWDPGDLMEFFTDRLCSGCENTDIIYSHLVDMFSTIQSYEGSRQAVLSLRRLWQLDYLVLHIPSCWLLLLEPQKCALLQRQWSLGRLHHTNRVEPLVLEIARKFAACARPHAQKYPDRP